MTTNFYINFKSNTNFSIRIRLLLLCLLFAHDTFSSDNLIYNKSNELIFVAEKTITHQFNAHPIPHQSINKCLNDNKNENTIFITQSGEIHNLHLITHAQLVFNITENIYYINEYEGQFINLSLENKTKKINLIAKVTNPKLKSLLSIKWQKNYNPYVYSAVLISSEKKILLQQMTCCVQDIYHSFSFLNDYCKKFFQYRQKYSHQTILAFSVRPPPPMV